MSSTILSTKRLTLAQRELALNGKLNIVEYDAITIEFQQFEIKTIDDYFIFTSQNGVRSYLENKKGLTSFQSKGKNLKAFCVGEKTRLLLENNGFSVEHSANNAEALGSVIKRDYKDHSFLYLTGNLRRHELPELLKQHNIVFHEIEAYRTTMNIKKFKKEFDGVLFYSPSGVRSFVAENDLSQTTAFCIGETTLSEAKKYTNRLVQANKPTMENVIVKAVKHYNT